ncbi:hypothetical protein P4O66_003311 [Electrophorus voltai]|uniref:Uncharacterized protein n=1 Tax=Electrophorus voltai TaxID=2609070 RepID=A0AAD9DLB9_9TELE|nr:hypothetical protein P4O66_003311 [Electrophorus voltai]
MSSLIYCTWVFANMGIIWPLGAPVPAPAPDHKMRRSSTDETPYRRSPSLDSKAGSPRGHYNGEQEPRGGLFGFGFRAAPGPQTAKAGYGTAQGRKYVVFYLDLSFIFLLELRRCRMAEGCMRALRYAMVFFNLLFWPSCFLAYAIACFPCLPSSVCLFIMYPCNLHIGSMTLDYSNYYESGFAPP